MIGTVKIIPYAVAGDAPRAGARGRGSRGGILRSRPTRRPRVGVISTLLPGLKPSVVDKTLAVLGRAPRAGRRRA